MSIAKEVTVKEQVGMNRRVTKLMIDEADGVAWSIWVEKDERKVNAESLSGVLSRGISKGTESRLMADGADGWEAVNALVELITSDFSEHA